jgi:hypothetical protein
MSNAKIRHRRRRRKMGRGFWAWAGLSSGARAEVWVTPGRRQKRMRIRTYLQAQFTDAFALEQSHPAHQPRLERP